LEAFAPHGIEAVYKNISDAAYNILSEAFFAAYLPL